MAIPKITDELSNPTISRQIVHQLAISNGRYGKRVLSAGESSPSGESYGWLMFITTTVFTAIADDTVIPEADAATALVPLIYAAGTAMPGRFKDITVDSGTVLCYLNAHSS